MTTVYLYGGSGKYSGTRAFEWESPKIGSTHKFILFVAHEGNEAQQIVAMLELEKFGFSEVQVALGKPIAVESLNEAQMQAFQKHYEGALAEGSSIVWYP